ncbi:hypothetical protein ACFU9X_38775 [Streptomyces atratus]|uniref:hypothetical protein n=1 Tax=Streptomyces atratus TaxID=1893 RepID=UPI003682D0ED
MQTLHGTVLLAASTRKHLKWVALAAGYTSLGLGERADHAMEMACLKPVDIPSAANRMARPLGEATVRALEMLRDLDDSFGWDSKLAIDAALAAPQATFPPPRD